jgi:hypothetical protein
MANQEQMMAETKAEMKINQESMEAKMDAKQEKKDAWIELMAWQRRQQSAKKQWKQVYKK